MGHSAALEIARRKMAQLPGVTSAVVVNGCIEVALASNSPELRESVLDLSRAQMMPVSIVHASSALVEQKKTAYQEWVDDYFTPIKVPGFAGEPREAPPEEITQDPKGALKLRRVRAKTRGRPVVAWRLGNEELRKGTPVKFSKEACLQWTMGRTLTVRPGAIAKVKELSSRRPIAFVELGEYEGVELPIHMLGHAYHVDKPKAESLGEAKKSKLTPEFQKIMKVIGMGIGPIGWGRDPAMDDVPGNDPYFRDGWIIRGGDDSSDTAAEDVEIEDVELPMARPVKNSKGKRLIVDKK